IMGDMDIAETRRPQDGRAALSVNGREFDLRVSSLPTVHGEKIVLRILDKENINVPLEKLGFLPDQLHEYEALIRRTYGMILVGEIRDRETAEVAIQAALTGHMVFSTLHTNTAAGAIMRLTNMNVEPFLIASAVVGVVAQRLARRVCPRCVDSYRPSRELLE